MLTNDVRCFKCELRRKGNQCKAMIKLDIHDKIIGEVNFHTHAPSQTQVEMAKVKASIPSTSTLRINIRKAREDNYIPHSSVTREDIAVLSELYQNTVVREPFLIYDSGVEDQERMFIFASEIGLELLRGSEHWYADGTFKVCSEIFY